MIDRIIDEVRMAMSHELYLSALALALTLPDTYAVRRKLLEICPDGKYDPSLLDKEYTELEQAHTETYAKFKAIREEYQQIHHIQSCVNKGLGNVEQAQQKKDNRKQEER